MAEADKLTIGKNCEFGLNMSDRITTVETLPNSSDSHISGRSFSISLKGIPKVDAKTMERMEAAARDPNRKRRDFPTLVLEK